MPSLVKIFVMSKTWLVTTIDSLNLLVLWGLNKL